MNQGVNVSGTAYVGESMPNGGRELAFVAHCRTPQDALLGARWVLEWSTSHDETPALVTHSRRRTQFNRDFQEAVDPFSWYSPHTFRSGAYWDGGAVLAAWLGIPDLRMLELDDRVQALCVLSWDGSELETWLDGRPATVLTEEVNSIR